jgi:hypothetical protein
MFIYVVVVDDFDVCLVDGGEWRICGKKQPNLEQKNVLFCQLFKKGCYRDVYFDLYLGRCYCNSLSNTFWFTFRCRW